MSRIVQLLATPENMRRVLKPAGSYAGQYAPVFAYSPHTGERYSANPGDYWNHPDGHSLLDGEGNRMILCKEVCKIVPVT